MRVKFLAGGVLPYEFVRDVKLCCNCVGAQVRTIAFGQIGGDERAFTRTVGAGDDEEFFGGHGFDCSFNGRASGEAKRRQPSPLAPGDTTRDGSFVVRS